MDKKEPKEESSSQQLTEALARVAELEKDLSDAIQRGQNYQEEWHEAELACRKANDACTTFSDAHAKVCGERDDLSRQTAAMRRTLEYYADADIYIYENCDNGKFVLDDNGTRARAALAPNPTPAQSETPEAQDNSGPMCDLCGHAWHRHDPEDGKSGR